MPVTINGDGSISGLAVGGLPDGSVDADTLASNAVTSAKLHNDAVVASKLPAGSIVKYQFTTSSTQTNITSSTTWNGQVRVSVNRSVAGGSYTAVASQMPGSYIQETYTRYFHISCNINFLDSPSYSLGNAITYKLQMKSGDTNITSGCMVSMGGVTNGASKLLLLEVAG